MKVAKCIAKVTVEAGSPKEISSRLRSIAERIDRGELKGDVSLEPKEITSTWEVKGEVFTY
jgi:hypothetical protein